MYITVFPPKKFFWLRYPAERPDAASGCPLPPSKIIARGGKRFNHSRMGGNGSSFITKTRGVILTNDTTKIRLIKAALLCLLPSVFIIIADVCVNACNFFANNNTILRCFWRRIMDAARREKKEHGTLAFPFQIYPALDGSEA